MSLVSQYESRLVAEGLTSDPDQLRVLESLQRLSDELAQPDRKDEAFLSPAPRATGG